MKLLILSNNPTRASFRQRIGVYRDLLKVDGIDSVLERIPKNLVGRWGLYRQAGGFDAVLLHKKTLNFADAKILRKFARKIIYDFDDAVMYSPKEPGKDKASRLRSFARTVGMADLVIAGNVYLAEHAKRYCGNVHVLPTGLDVKRYDITKSKPADDTIRLVWIGSKSTLRYLEQISSALSQIGRKYSHVVLRVIADAFPEIPDISIEKVSWSQEHEVDDLISSDIGLAPLEDDRFTRGKCGFKILQYFSAGLPCVASPVGMNQDLVLDNKTGILAQTESEWVAALGRLIEDWHLRSTMGTEGRRTAEEYDLDRIGRQFVKLTGF